MLSAYLIIGGVSVLAVGGVLLENHLLKRDEVGTAELLSGVMDYTMKYGKFAIVGYFLYRIAMMF